MAAAERRNAMVRLGDALDPRLEAELQAMKQIATGRAPDRAAANVVPIEWPLVWREEHVTMRAAPRTLPHATLDLVRASPRSPWADCPACVEGWVEKLNDIGQTFQTACRCRGVRLLCDRINRAELPALAHTDNWRLDRIDWRTLDAGDAGPPRRPSKARVLRDGQVCTATVREAVEAFVRDWQKGRRGLVIQGTNGVGKSHLAYAVEIELVLAGVNARSVAWADYLERHKASFDAPGRTADDIRRAFIDCDLLVIEELGGRWTEWSGAQAEDLIYARHLAQRTTIVTTNLTFAEDPQDRGSLMGFIGERAHSRLIGSCDVAMVRGKDWRTKHLNTNTAGAR